MLMMCKRLGHQVTCDGLGVHSHFGSTLGCKQTMLMGMMQSLHIKLQAASWLCHHTELELICCRSGEGGAGTAGGSTAQQQG